MKVEATWRGPGRLEILVQGVSPSEAEGLLETLGASVSTPEPLAEGPVGWAEGTPAGVFFPATWHLGKIKAGLSAANTQPRITPKE